MVSKSKRMAKYIVIVASNKAGEFFYQVYDTETGKTLVAGPWSSRDHAQRVADALNGVDE